MAVVGEEEKERKGEGERQFPLRAARTARARCDARKEKEAREPAQVFIIRRGPRLLGQEIREKGERGEPTDHVWKPFATMAGKNREILD